MMRRAYSSPYLWLAALFAVFLGLRLVHLDRVFLWIDDVHTVSIDSPDELVWDNFIADAYQHSLDTTTPFLPALVLRLLSKLFGASPLLLRLPTLVVAALSFWALHCALVQVSETPAARWGPLVWFTLSVPAIIYAQAVQPSMYYFLTTALQLGLFVGMVRDLKPFTTSRVIFRRIQVFTLVSTGLFFANYMSLLIYAWAIGTYLFLVYRRTRRDALQKTLLAAFNTLLVALPLVVLAYLRSRAGDAAQRAYFEGTYYPESPGDVLTLVYDLLTYHFNFAYTPALYEPLGANLLALPFIVLVLLGVGYFGWRYRDEALLPLVAGVGGLLLAGALKIMPLGGVRHSLTLAPLLLVAAGFGVRALAALVPKRGPQVAQSVVVVLSLLAGVVFLVSGTRLYRARETRIDLAALLDWAQQHNATAIVGNCEMYNVLEIMDDGDLHAADLELLPSCDAPLEQYSEPYLLVDYRRTFNPDPDWPPLAWGVQINAAAFDAVQVTTLHEDPGPLDPGTMGVQSVYYPLNGFFVYLITPR